MNDPETSAPETETEATTRQIPRSVLGAERSRLLARSVLLTYTGMVGALVVSIQAVVLALVMAGFPPYAAIVLLLAVTGALGLLTGYLAGAAR